MKNFITGLLFLSSAIMFAQNAFFRHTVTDENSVANLTSLDHTLLNDNPDAKMVLSHNWAPEAVYNNHPTGMFYNEITGVWFLFNEDFVNMIEGASFNIYIAGDDEIVSHIASEANQGNAANTSLINDDRLDNNFGRLVIVSHTFTDSKVANPLNYGIFYNDIADKRGIFSEDGVAIPEDATFNVFISGVYDNVVNYRHQANEDNIQAYFTNVDHPLLNDNPDAIFLAEHYFGVLPNSNVNHDHVIGVQYNGAIGRWQVHNEDLFPMSEGVVFDLIISDPDPLSIEDSGLQELAMFPNPTENEVTLKVPEHGIIQLVQVFDMNGRLLSTQRFRSQSNRVVVDISTVAQGIYSLAITSNLGSVTKKLVKK